MITNETLALFERLYPDKGWNHYFILIESRDILEICYQEAGDPGMLVIAEFDSLDELAGFLLAKEASNEDD